MRDYPVRIAVGLALLLLGISLPAHAADPPAAVVAAPKLPDVRVLFDVSTAVRDADPDNIRSAAASLLLRTLPEEGRAGIWVYADRVSRLVAHGQSDLFWKRLATIHTRQFESRGQHANLPEALKAATWDLDSPDAFQRHVIVVSNGAMDPGGGMQASAKAGDALLRTAIEKLAAGGVRVHAIVIPGGSPGAMLRQLAERTGGMYLPAQSLGDLGRQFERLLQHTSRPSALPVRDGAFLVEPGLPEMTLWRAGDEPDIVLTDPAGRTHTRAAPGVSVRWHDARGYDVLTIADPMPGRWRFEGEGRSTVLAYGDLALRVGDVPATVFPGHLNHVEFMLFSGSEAVTDDAFLAMTRASAQLIGEHGPLPLFVEAKADGIFRVTMTDEVNGGDYMLEVLLEGPTFARKAAIPFQLANPVKVRVRQDGKDAVAFAELADPAVDYGSLSAAAQVRQPPGPRRLVPARAMPGGLWQIRVPGASGSIEIALSLHGRYHNQKAFQLQTEPLQFTAPLTTEQVYRFDARGKALPDRQPPVTMPPVPMSGPAAVGTSPLPAAGQAPPNAPPAIADAQAPTEREMPLWFALAISGVNLMLALCLGLFLSRRRAADEVRDWLHARTAAAG